MPVLAAGSEQGPTQGGLPKEDTRWACALRQAQQHPALVGHDRAPSGVRAPHFGFGHENRTDCALATSQSGVLEETRPTAGAAAVGRRQAGK